MGKADVEQQAGDAEEHRAGQELRHRALDRLFGTDLGEEPVASEPKTGHHGGGIPHPDGAEDRDDGAEAQVIGVWGVQEVERQIKTQRECEVQAAPHRERPTRQAAAPVTHQYQRAQSEDGDGGEQQHDASPGGEPVPEQ